VDYLKEARQRTWPVDLEFYLFWKRHAKTYPTEKSERILADRRKAMVERYGESAMKDI